MKTLLDRLKDEHVIVLHHKGEEFPLTVEYAFNELKDKSAWTDLRYRTICYLVNTFSLKDYSPTTISNLFND